MDYPFKSFVFRPLPENPTARDWWEIKLLMHQLRAYTDAAMDTQAKYLVLTKVLINNNLVKQEEFTPDLERQAAELSSLPYIELTQGIDRFEAWLKAKESPSFSEPPPTIPPL